MRAAKIQQILKKQELDGILITTYENRRYVSGFTGSDGVILITQDEAVLFVDGRYTLQAQLETKEFKVVEFQVSPYKLLTDYKLNNLSIEDKKLPIAHYKQLKEILKETHFHNGSWILDDLRTVKTEDEIKLIQKAAEIADNAFEHIIKFIKQGMTEIEIALELEFFMRHNGAEGVSFDTIVASSARSALPHAQPTNRKIENGDIVLMDYGCIYDGYCSDMTRTVIMGEATAKQQEIYNTVLKAQQAGLENVKNGASGAEVDKSARIIIEEAGYGTNFTHSLGHGVGLEVHENPTLSPRSVKKLQSGNVVTVEPGIYIQNLFGVRIEDLVVVTDEGCLNLTKSPKELIVL